MLFVRCQTKRRKRSLEQHIKHLNFRSKTQLYHHAVVSMIQVDIFGTCPDGSGKPKCKDCFQRVERDYMFYLAFENSFCDDYVTEKMWRWLKKDVVPVVMGKADYSGMIELSCTQSSITSHWQKSQVQRSSDCCSADFSPRLLANQP